MPFFSLKEAATAIIPPSQIQKQGQGVGLCCENSSGIRLSLPSSNSELEMTKLPTDKILKYIISEVIITESHF